MRIMSNNIHEGIEKLLEEDVFMKIRDVIVMRFGVQQSRVHNALRFVELGAETLDVVEVALEVEDIFDIRFRSSTAASFKTIGDVVSEVTQLLSAK